VRGNGPNVKRTRIRGGAAVSFVKITAHLRAALPRRGHWLRGIKAQFNFNQSDEEAFWHLPHIIHASRFDVA